MANLQDTCLVVAISSRALFDLDESNAIYEQDGIQAYADYQIAHENEPLAVGGAYQLVKKLLKLNEDQTRVEVILLSRNSADTGLRIFNSIEHYGLEISRAAFTNGERPYPYLHAFRANLFLSAHAEDVRLALKENFTAARILTSDTKQDAKDDILRIAFDGDAVLFSDDAERVYQEKGLKAFAEHEQRKANEPLKGGPFQPVLSALHALQQDFSPEACPIRTALVTARSAPAHERVVKTLRAWGVRIDEALFLGGLDKGQFLKAFGADIYFDDQMQHCDDVAKHIPAGHVLGGICNRESS